MQRQNLVLNELLTATLQKLQERRGDLYQKFSKILFGLLKQDDFHISEEEISKIVAKKRYALHKISQVAPDELYSVASTKYAQRLKALKVDLEDLWGTSEQSVQFGFERTKNNSQLCLWPLFRQNIMKFQSLPLPIIKSRAVFDLLLT